MSSSYFIDDRSVMYNDKLYRAINSGTDCTGCAFDNNLCRLGTSSFMNLLENNDCGCRVDRRVDGNYVSWELVHIKTKPTDNLSREQKAMIDLILG